MKFSLYCIQKLKYKNTIRMLFLSLISALKLVTALKSIKITKSTSYIKN